MTKSSMLRGAGLALLGLGAGVLASQETCGDAPYDTDKYVCYDSHFLCPVVAGEPTAYCNGACYSPYMYECTNNQLAARPALAAGTPFTLTVDNPTQPAVHGLAVNACGLRWNIGGSTCAYCPESQADSCPAGNITVVTAAASEAAQYGMDVVVPGGQQIYLDPNGSVGYTQAHSAATPAGSTLTGLVAYQGSGNTPGGFVNLNSGGWGWVACPPDSDSSSGAYSLIALNSTNAGDHTSCTAVNLLVNVQPSDTVGAWQYS